jgi:hypothetical protein
MARKLTLGIAAAILASVALAASAQASTTTRLVMSEGAAFAVLGHSCGGIQEQVYVRGFGAKGYPIGNVHMQTSCGGSGRDGGGHTTTYTATASVEWTWFGETRSYSAPGGPLVAEEATDGYGDRVYNVGTVAYLETTAPPLQPPGPPTGVTASVALAEGTPEYLRMSIGWTVAPETAGLLKYSTMTATPVNNPAAPVLTETRIPYFESGSVAPVQPKTTYVVTVTSTDSEGTSEPSAPIEITSPNSDGEAPKEQKRDACTSNHGKISLSPGLTETPAVQKVTISGELSGCDGPNVPETGKYTAHETTTEAVACPQLSSASIEPEAIPVSFAIKWLPLEEGTSKGKLFMPVSETPMTGMSGTITGGPFSSSTPIKAAFVGELFKGAALCGVPQGKLQVVKPVKSGTFTTSEVEFQ